MDISSRALLAVLSALNLTSTAFASGLVFLGPRGSYSDEAASKYISRAHLDSTIALAAITEIAQAVGEGRAQFGLLPFENSTGGFVGETHKLLLAPQDPGWRVIGDMTVPISNNLLVKPGTRASDLRKIVSHPEALKECANWLKTKFPQLAQESMSSTAAAAEAVSKGDGTIAAIASSAAARVYELQILFSNIQDNQHNATNFVVIQTAGRDFLEQNPTRLIVRIDVKKGDDALGQLSEELKHLSFALTSAGSGPTGTLGSHRFALIFDSPHGADLSQIQSTLRPIGAYRPVDITP